MRSEHEASFSPRDGDWAADGEPARAAVADVAREESETKAGKPAVVEEVLIEEVSIDGMCGVY